MALVDLVTVVTALLVLHLCFMLLPLLTLPVWNNLSRDYSLHYPLKWMVIESLVEMLKMLLRTLQPLRHLPLSPLMISMPNGGNTSTLARSLIALL